MRKSRFTEAISGAKGTRWSGREVRKYGVSDATSKVAIPVWRDGGLRRPQAQSPGRREPSAEEAVGGVDAGRIDTQGDA